MRKKKLVVYRAVYEPGKGWKVLINRLEPMYDEAGRLICA